MLLLTSVSDLITVTTGSAGSVAVHVSYVDNNAGAITFGRTNTPLIATAATTTVCAAPASGVQRNVKKISINNVSGSVANLVTVSHTDGTTVIALWDATLAVGESAEMQEDGTWIYYDSTGMQKVNQAISATAWNVPGTIGLTTPNTGWFTTLRTTNTLGVGVASGTPWITVAAGTATVASMSITGGTVLTTAAAGSFENDSIAPYFTTNTTDGRGIIPIIQQFRLTANGAAFNTISNFFGTTSNISLVASAYYEIDIEVYFTKTTAEAVTWTFTNSAAPTSMNIHYEQSPITGIVAPGSTAVANLAGDIVNSVTAAQTIVTGTLTTAVTHYARFKIWLKNGTGTSLKIQAACTTASGITPLLGSRWISRRIPTGNTGTFAA